MNYLQLVNETLSESGLLDGELLTLDGATGMAAKVKRQVARAWQKIQLDREDWRFRWQIPAEQSVPQDQQTFLATALCPNGLGALDTEKLYLVVDGQRRQLSYIDWADMANGVITGSPTACPTAVSVDPAGNIVFNTIPDQAYGAVLCYYRSAQTLTADTDTPYLHADLHPAIVYQAIMLYAKHDEAPNLAVAFKEEFGHWMNRVNATQKPRVRWAGSELSDAADQNNDVGNRW